MKNEIKRITEDDYRALTERTDSEGRFVVTLDGTTIQSVPELFDAMEKAYGFRVSGGSWGRNWSAFSDMMRDLWWIDSDRLVLFILHFDRMLAHYPAEKERLTRRFTNSILPFWEKDVLNCVVGGKTKEFTVYLVDQGVCGQPDPTL